MGLASVVLAALIIWAAPAIADSYILACIPDRAPDPAQPLILDLDQKLMTWHGNYKIINITDRYLTAIENNEGSVGGEIFIFDRANGEYYRAVVALTDTGLEATTYTGRCINPLVGP
jgi:hypothetical protein